MKIRVYPLLTTLQPSKKQLQRDKPGADMCNQPVRKAAFPFGCKKKRTRKATKWKQILLLNKISQFQIVETCRPCNVLKQTNKNKGCV